ncbi:MAG: glutamate--tRNA ligase [Euryarchaeota archaeon]|nr:glutamate--tRNA ligase [Euryarchaeota archaeon]
MEPAQVRALARKFALVNAANYSGKASDKAVLSRLLADRSELRPRARELLPLVKAVVEEVNGLPPEKQREALAAEFPETLVKEERKEKERTLPPLVNVRGRVVMRFAPGPSGPLHLGHTRAAILNDEYARAYGGDLVLRIEDTDPDRVLPESYDMIREDLDWLGVRCTSTVIQTDRFPRYYDAARRLLGMGAAYVCLCAPEDWRLLKQESRPCPHRDAPPGKNLELWDMMLDHAFPAEKASMVVKTDLSHPDPAIRDFVAMRVVDTPHPRTGTKYRVYPLMNFSVAVDDHELGLTHVLRGKDHQKNTWRQAYLFDYLKWPVPEYIHYGRISIEDAVLSKSEIERGVSSGEYSGWDDVRLGTVRALAKRGIRPEAIRRYWVEVGTKEVDIRFSWQNLYAHNRDLVDDGADRLFFVWDPTPLWILGAPPLEGRAPVHPAHPERGVRKTVVGDTVPRQALERLFGSGQELPKALQGQPVLVCKEDLAGLSPGARLRLKDLCNIELSAPFEARHIGNDLGILKEGAKIIHWAALDGVPAEVQLESGEWARGVAEKGAREAAGRLVQFERFGYVRLDRWEAALERLVGYFAHK